MTERSTYQGHEAVLALYDRAISLAAEASC